MIAFKIHVKILSMYLKYYFKYMYFKILPITASISGNLWHQKQTSVRNCISHADGLTENAGHENDEPSKLQGMKLQDMKLTDQCAGHEIARPEITRQEIAGHENTGHENTEHEQ